MREAAMTTVCWLDANAEPTKDSRPARGLELAGEVGPSTREIACLILLFLVPQRPFDMACIIEAIVNIDSMQLV